MPSRSHFVGLRIEDEEPKPLTEKRLSCKLCDFITPAGSGHAVNSLRSHERNTHEGWAEQKRTRPQFLALIEASGSFNHALQLADTVITWTRPSEETLREWAIEAENAELEGKRLVTDDQVARMQRRMRRAEEWASRLTLRSMRNAATKLADEVTLTGDLPKPQLLQYTGMNVSYMEKEIGNAHGTSGQQTAHINKLVINAGPPPPKKLRAPKALPQGLIDGEFREVKDGG